MTAGITIKRRTATPPLKFKQENCHKVLNKDKKKATQARHTTLLVIFSIVASIMARSMDRRRNGLG